MIDHKRLSLDPDAQRRLVDSHMAGLRQRYPYQFPQTLPDYMLDPEPGWLPIIDALCHDVDRLLPAEVRIEFQWTQIKEKFGTLRAYWSLGPLFYDVQCPDGVVSGTVPRQRPDQYEVIWDAIDQRIQSATAESARTCGECGAPGTLRRLRWVRTLCDRHADRV